MLRVPSLVSTQWLATNLSKVVVVDASWHMDRSARAEYQQRHIAGAVFFDIEAISDTLSSLPHMLPSEAGFSAAVGALGISAADHVVVYDSAGIFSAPRAWFSFRVFGHQSVVRDC